MNVQDLVRGKWYVSHARKIKRKGSGTERIETEVGNAADRLATEQSFSSENEAIAWADKNGGRERYYIFDWPQEQEASSS